MYANKLTLAISDILSTILSSLPIPVHNYDMSFLFFFNYYLRSWREKCVKNSPKAVIGLYFWAEVLINASGFLRVSSRIFYLLCHKLKMCCFGGNCIFIVFASIEYVKAVEYFYVLICTFVLFFRKASQCCDFYLLFAPSQVLDFFVFRGLFISILIYFTFLPYCSSSVFNCGHSWAPVRQWGLIGTQVPNLAT